MTSLPVVAKHVPEGEAAPELLSAGADRWFVLAGAWLVPVPIVAWYLARACGLPNGAAEDVVTLLVMVPLGGPHVVATFRRTLFEPSFWRARRAHAFAAIAVLLMASGSAIASAFLGARIAGAPPMAWLLTFFFFWAGLHVVQQHGYVVRRLAAAEGVPSSFATKIEQAVLLLALYPVSLFRMSMANGAHSATPIADPEAWATQLLRACGASVAFTDDYVFRIGRSTPILPDLMRHPSVWIAVTVAFLACCAVFATHIVQALRKGERLGRRRALVLTVATTCALVPLLPNLDSAFQGINAWHSFQYLGLAMVLQREAVARGEVTAPALVRVAQPGEAWRAYWRALALTLGLVAGILGLAICIEVVSGGAFVMFGHDFPPSDAKGQLLYRPGSVLLAYWLLGFGFLLVHYLFDTMHFVRLPKQRLTAG